MQSLQVRESRRSLNLCLRLVGQSVGYVVCATRMPRFVGAFANAITWAIIKCKFSFHLSPSPPVHFIRVSIRAVTHDKPPCTIIKLRTLANMPKKHKKSAKAKEEHDAAVEDIVTHFAQTYIFNDRLSAFQQLCRDLDVEVGSGIKKCREVF